MLRQSEPAEEKSATRAAQPVCASDRNNRRVGERKKSKQLLGGRSLVLLISSGVVPTGHEEGRLRPHACS